MREEAETLFVHHEQPELQNPSGSELNRSVGNSFMPDRGSGDTRTNKQDATPQKIPPVLPEEGRLNDRACASLSIPHF